jgi:dipeptidyl aminopeptidase/acylaminoacyl peptidase
VVAAAYAHRDPLPPARRRAVPVRAALALGVLLVVVGALLSPPGRAVLDSVREAIGVEHAQRALFSLPARGNLLVASGRGGAWVVHADGSKRRLGGYRETSWSPHGRFVVAAKRDEVVALQPNGDVHWTLARPDVRFPRWAGSATDTRVAYLSRRSLRVVAGDATGDHLVAAGVDRTPPAWRPGSSFVLVFARRGSIVAVDTTTGARQWTRHVPGVRELEWSREGDRLLVRTPRSLIVLDQRGRRLFDLLSSPRGLPVAAAAFAPDGHAVAFVRGTADESEVWLVRALPPDASAPQRLFAGHGTFSGVVWSPDGRWLLVAWPDADQWLFFRSAGVHAVRAVSGISRQFGSFPALGGWCCVTGS